MSFRKKYNSADVMRAVMHSLEPPARWKLRYHSDNYQYAQGGAYPGELSNFRNLRWMTLALDADATHLGSSMLQAARDVVGCRLASERISTPSARPFIEGFHKWFKRSLDGAPTATGNNPQSPSRRAPEGAAVKYSVVAPLAEEWLDIYSRNYNNTRQAALDGLSPLQRLQFKFERGEIFRSPLGLFKPSALWRLMPMWPATLTRTRGKFGALGANLFGARYTCKELASDYQLMYAANLACRLYVQEDARFAFLVPEAFPGKCFEVAVTGKFSAFPHTLEWRRLAYNYYKSAGMQGLANNPQLMFGLTSALADAAKEDDSAAYLLSGVVAFMDRFGAGNAYYVQSSPTERDRLIEFTRHEEGADEEEGADRPQTEGGALPDVGKPRSDGADPLGLL